MISRISRAVSVGVKVGKTPSATADLMRDRKMAAFEASVEAMREVSGAVVGIVNNTESIYYDDDGKKKQTDLQMVVKNAAMPRGLIV